MKKRPAKNRAETSRAWLRNGWMRTALLLSVLTLTSAWASGCGPKTVKLTIQQLHDLEACVLEQDDQVERQNCVERLFPKGER